MRETLEDRINQASDLKDVLLILKEVTLKDTHVSTLAYLGPKVEEFNEKYGIYECQPFPLEVGQSSYNIHAYYFDEAISRLSEGDIVLIIYTDRNFINNLYASDHIPKETQDQGNHLIKYGIIVPINGKEDQPGNFVRYDTASQGLTDLEKSNARSNIGAGTSNFSGDYNDLSNKPDLSVYALSSSLSVVATSGDYNDLSNKPTIPAAQVQSDWDQTNTDAVDYIKNKPTIPVVNYPVTDVQVDGSSVLDGTVAKITDMATKTWVGEQGYITGITVTDNNPTLDWSTKSKVATVAGVEIHVTMPAQPPASSNYYLTEGSWNGTTYSFTSNGGNPAVSFTLPTIIDTNLSFKSSGSADKYIDITTANALIESRYTTGYGYASFDYTGFYVRHYHTPSTGYKFTADGFEYYVSDVLNATFLLPTASGQATYTIATQEWVQNQGYITSYVNYYHTPQYSTGLLIGASNSSDNLADLYVPYATSSRAGLISTGTQTFGGEKTWNDSANFQSDVGIFNDSTLSLNGYLKIYSGTSNDSIYIEYSNDDNYFLQIKSNENAQHNYYLDVEISSPTADRRLSLPDETGTLATREWVSNQGYLTSYNNYYHIPLFSTGLNIATGSGVNNMYVPDASTSQSGVVTTGSQSFTGEKTFVAKSNEIAMNLQIDNDNNFGISICDKNYTTHKYYFGLETTNATHDMKINIPFESTSLQNTYTFATREWVSSRGYLTGITSGMVTTALGYTPSSTDTKNTAGTTNKTGTKMFLVGATEQSANPQTYSNSNCYIGTDNCLYSDGTKVLTSHQSLSGYLKQSDFEYNSTTRVLKLKWL